MLTDREFLTLTREHTHTSLSADLWVRLNAVTPDTSDELPSPVCMDGEGYDRTDDWTTLAMGMMILIVFVAGAVIGGVLCST